MVIKGGSRGGAGELAKHLQRTDTNERMELREVRGVVVGSVDGALREMEAVSAGARSRKPFYHASINTPRNEELTEAQKATTIDRLEEKLGLTGQPRVVVEHVKAGRTHLHVAWSRIDGETLTAIPDSHNFRKHEEVARDLEREFGHKRVQGVHHERDGVERPQRRPSLAETRQAERSGVEPQDAKAQLRELWNAADNGKAFTAALNEAGWTLAQGDKRGFVALDPAGEARAINKDITGLTAAKVRERLADLDAAKLPSVDEARAQQRQRAPTPLQAKPSPMAPVNELETPALAPVQQAAPAQTGKANAQLFPGGEAQQPAKQASPAVDLQPAKPDAPAEAQFKPQSKSPNLGSSEGAADLPQATQRPSHAAEPAQKAADRRQEASRLRQVIDRARERLDALGGRLEAAFDRFRQMIDPKRQADTQPLQNAPKPETPPKQAAAKAPTPRPPETAAPAPKTRTEQLRKTLASYRRPIEPDRGGPER